MKNEKIKEKNKIMEKEEIQKPLDKKPVVPVKKSSQSPLPFKQKPKTNLSMKKEENIPKKEIKKIQMPVKKQAPMMEEKGRIKTGIEGLDLMLKGGFLKGRSILLSGPSGSGKSTLAIQFAYNGALKGEKSLYVTLEEKKGKIIEDMLKFGFDLKEAEKKGNFMIFGGPIAELTSTMKKVDADIYNLINEIEEIVKEHKIKRVVIDSINILTMLVDGESKRRMALATLSNTLSSLGCTSILTSETEEGTMKLSKYGIEEFIVDGVIVLYLVRQGSRFVPGIVIRKLRGSNHDKEIRLLKITNQGIVVYPQETMFGKI